MNHRASPEKSQENVIIFENDFLFESTQLSSLISVVYKINCWYISKTFISQSLLSKRICIIFTIGKNFKISQQKLILSLASFQLILPLHPSEDICAFRGTSLGVN